MRELLEQKIPLVLADLPDQVQEWQVIPALFARAGATVPARATLANHGGILVDLLTLFADLAE